MGKKSMGRGLLVLLINLWCAGVFFEMEGAPEWGRDDVFQGICVFCAGHFCHILSFADLFLHHFDVPKFYRFPFVRF
jgi:hypothetical protein